MCRWDGARSLKGGAQEGQIPRDLALGGGVISRGSEIPGTPGPSGWQSEILPTVPTLHTLNSHSGQGNPPKLQNPCQGGYPKM